MSRGVHPELTAGLIRPGELDAKFRPMQGSNGRPILVLCHGWGASNPLEWVDPVLQPASVRLIQQIVYHCGVPAIGSEFGGTHTWGNDLAVASVRSVLDVRPIVDAGYDEMILLGVSMGGLLALNVATQWSELVLGGIGIITCANPEDVRTRDASGLRNSVNTGWDMPVGSTMATNPLPTRAKPLENAAAIAAGGGRWRFYGSTADLRCPSSFVDTLAASLRAEGADAQSIHTSTTLDHSDALVGLTPIPEVCRFIRELTDAA